MIRVACGGHTIFWTAGAPPPDTVGRQRALSTKFHILPTFRGCSIGRTSSISRHQCLGEVSRSFTEEPRHNWLCPFRTLSRK